jgi:uncharacterized protein (TIGR02118 family)
MAKRIILYNLAPHTTDEAFKEYVTSEKGPLIESLPAVKKYELVKITSSMREEIPYKYCGIVHMTSIKEFEEKATVTPEYQAFFKKFAPMVTDLLILSGEEIY